MYLLLPVLIHFYFYFYFSYFSSFFYFITLEKCVLFYWLTHFILHSHFIKHFIITKLIDHKEKDKYVQLTRDLYEHRGLDEDDFNELINISKPINSSRNYIDKEKDDYER